MKNVFLLSLAFSAGCLLPAGAEITVRSANDGILWPVVMDVSQPFAWRWSADDTRAGLVVSCRTAKASAAYVIGRTSGSDVGTQFFSLPSECTARQEHLFDMALTIYAGENVRTTYVARVVYLPAVTEDAIGVRVPATRDWTHVRGPVAIGYSPEWKDETVGAASARLDIALDGGRAAGADLSAKGGWHALDGETLYLDAVRGGLGLTLGFGSITDAWSAELTWMPKVGFLLFLR